MPPGACTTIAFIVAPFRGLNFNRVTSGVMSSNTASTGSPMRSAPASTPTGLENSRTPQSSRTWITVYGTADRRSRLGEKRTMSR